MVLLPFITLCMLNKNRSRLHTEIFVLSFNGKEVLTFYIIFFFCDLRALTQMRMSCISAQTDRGIIVRK